MGVYGTIIGAGLVSTVATAGTAVFQHLFRRTGEQLRDVAAGAANSAPKGLHKASGTLPRPDGTLLLRTAEPPPYGTHGEAATHTAGRRPRWKSLPATALGVFLTAMAVIVGIEKPAGGPVSNAWGEHRTGTSFSPGRSDGGGSSDDGAGNVSPDAAGPLATP